MTPAPSGLPAVGEVIGARYRVLGILGKGGFGAVYRAQHLATGQELAVKVLRTNHANDEIHMRRFFTEARAASALHHPNTLRVHDFGQTDAGLLYQAMEMLKGQTLLQLLKLHKRLEPLRAVRIAIQVLKSLAEAHASGFVHRDLKPDNIFVCDVRGEQDFVKVIDFGIAKIVQPPDAEPGGAAPELTRTGFTVGTPQYMSPEQVRSKGIDGRSDLYSLGVILWHCVVGAPPFQADTPMGTMLMHVEVEPEPIFDHVQQPLPAGLGEIVMQALRKRPADRFADADEMRRALEIVLDTATAPVTPPTRQAADRTTVRQNATLVEEAAPGMPATRLAEVPRRSQRRQTAPWWPWAAGALVLCLAGAVGFLLWGGSDRDREESAPDALPGAAPAPSPAPHGNPKDNNDAQQRPPVRVTARPDPIAPPAVAAPAAPAPPHPSAPPPAAPPPLEVAAPAPPTAAPSVEKASASKTPGEKASPAPVKRARRSGAPRGLGDVAL